MINIEEYLQSSLESVGKWYIKIWIKCGHSRHYVQALYKNSTWHLDW